MIFQHLMRRVLENQHKLIQFLQQNSVRSCSGTARLQEVPKEDDTDFMNLNTITPSASYYPMTKPFNHDADVGEQFKVRTFEMFFKYREIPNTTFSVKFDRNNFI